MSLTQKIVAIILSLILLSITLYLLILNYNNNISSKHNEYLLDDNIQATERYKIINIIYQDDQIYAIVHCDNGNIKMVRIHEIYLEPTLKNINEGYLYRDSRQIYIRAE